MRITNMMMINNMMGNLNTHLNRMDKIDNQVSTGKRINRPSDDPVGTAQVLKFTSDISAHEQYKKNADEANSWLDATETAVSQLKDVLQRVRELTVRGASGTMAEDDKKAIQKEIVQLKDQMVAIGNTTFAGKYLFGGYKTTEKPFTIEETEVGSKIKYNGKFISPEGIVDGDTDSDKFKEFLTNENNKGINHGDMNDEIKIEIGTANFMKVNITGDDLIGQGFGGAFETLTKLEKVLNGEEDYKHGFVDMEYGTGNIAGINLGDSDTSKSITIQIDKDTFVFDFPKGAVTEADIQKAIDEHEFLKKKGIKVKVTGSDIEFTGNIKFSATVDGKSVYKTTPITLADLNNTLKDKTLSIDGMSITLPDSNPLTQGEIQGAIDAHDELKKKGIKVIIAAPNMTFEGDEEFTISTNIVGGTPPMTATQTIDSKNSLSSQMFSSLLIGERLEGALETSDTDTFELAVGGTTTSIPLPKNKKYELDTIAGRKELISDIQAEIDKSALKGTINVSFTDDFRLKFTGNKKDDTNTFDDIKISGAFVNQLGLSDGQASEKVAVKSAKLDTSSMLDDIDDNMANILSRLSELGAKTNRLELDKNRIDDNILNFTKLLSKAQDVDMAKAIMDMKMEENIYRAALSVGAKIIQPTLLDFLR
ncbi:flagellar hook-associated protein FlgL [Lutibacter sp. B2]|nr:flagellar hook-associated protein FlgL [Lutibacter sp. B2]